MKRELELLPSTRMRLAGLKGFKLNELTGPLPVAAHGVVQDHCWFFLARGKSWSIEVGGSPTFSHPPIWWHDEAWASDCIDAGYMTADEAATCIIGAINQFGTEDRAILTPGDPAYGNHLLRAWSEGFISATAVGEGRFNRSSQHPQSYLI